MNIEAHNELQDLKKRFYEKIRKVDIDRRIFGNTKDDLFRNMESVFSDIRHELNILEENTTQEIISHFDKILTD